VGRSFGWGVLFAFAAHRGSFDAEGNPLGGSRSSVSDNNVGVPKGDRTWLPPPYTTLKPGIPPKSPGLRLIGCIREEA